MEHFQNRSEYDKVCIQFYNNDLQNKRVDHEVKYFNRVLPSNERTKMNKHFMTLNPMANSNGCEN